MDADKETKRIQEAFAPAAKTFPLAAYDASLPLFSIQGLGYISRKHAEAIRAVDGQLFAAFSPASNVGFLDQYFQGKYNFFNEEHKFNTFMGKLATTSEHKFYEVITSPNDVHFIQALNALSRGNHVICEKPLVVNTRNLDELAKIEKTSQGKVNTILQLRLAEPIKELKRKYANFSGIEDIELIYNSARGPWYDRVWKGDVEKSGGLVTAIGIHLFDMLQYCFGENTHNQVYIQNSDVVSGYSRFEKANVKWFLSNRFEDYPEELQQANFLRKRNDAYRVMNIGDETIDFSQGFTELHTESYRQILSGNGFGIEDARPGLKIVESIRNSPQVPLEEGKFHPYLLSKRG